MRRLIQQQVQDVSFDVILSIEKPNGLHFAPLYHLINYGKSCDCKYARKLDHDFSCCTNMNLYDIHPNWSLQDLGINCSEDCRYYRKGQKRKLAWVKSTTRVIYLKIIKRYRDTSNWINENGKQIKGHHIVLAFQDGQWKKTFYAYAFLYGQPWRPYVVNSKK